jgi:hypothetical protein
MGISFKFKQDADPQIKQAVEEGKATMLDAYNAGQAVMVNNPRQYQFRNSPVFDPVEHENLAFRLESIMEISNVTLPAMCTSCRGNISEPEMAQLYHYGVDPRGLVYTNDIPGVFKRMELVTAAHIRQHRDARIYQADFIIEYWFEHKRLPDGKLLVVPDFYPDFIEDKSTDPYLRRKINIMSLLQAMVSGGRRANIFIGNPGTFIAIYGHQAEALLRDNFVKANREVFNG